VCCGNPMRLKLDGYLSVNTFKRGFRQGSMMVGAPTGR